MNRNKRSYMITERVRIGRLGKAIAATTLALCACLCAFLCALVWGIPQTALADNPNAHGRGNLGNDVLYYIVVDRFLDGEVDNNVPDFAFAPTGSDNADIRAYKQMNRLLLEHTYDPTHRYMGMYWGGDLQGVIQRLDYLQDLGITKIVLSPIQDNANGIFYHPDIENYLHLSVVEAEPGDNFYRHVSTPYHGYWTKDWFEIDEHFRVPEPESDRFELFRQLLDEAGERGIGVVLDLTMNQTSPGHISTEKPDLTSGTFLFGESWFADNGNVYRHGDLVATHWNPKTGERDPQGWFHPPAIIWDFDTASQELIENGQISGGMPDLNQDAPQVERYLLDAARFWLTLNEGGHQVAGFRLDAVKHINARFWRKFEDFVLSINPDAVLLGEYFSAGYRNLGSIEFLGQTEEITVYDFNISEAMRRYFARDRGWDGRSYVLRENCLGRKGTYYNYTPLNYWAHRLLNPAQTLEIPKPALDAIPDEDAKGWVTFIENHDQPRLKSYYPQMSDRAYASLIEFQFVARGVPLIMYGAETALGVPYHPDHAGLFGVGGDPFNRPMMIWPGAKGWKPDLHETTRKMAHLRQEHPVLRYGSTRFLSPKGANEDRDIFMLREPEANFEGDRDRVLYAYSTDGGEFLLSQVEGVEEYEVVDTGEQLKATDGLIPIKLAPQESRVFVLR